ncbi:MAG: GUN4 domain-containing protein [Symploca sp. SIO2C1]|nr:GUN4 domain-containing protein [Symploca sp. SIO2C1]
MDYYTKLQNLLIANKWKEADQQTSRIILLVAGQEQRGWLDYKDIEQFPSFELCMIDEIWLKYSNIHFGLTVQKDIWEQVSKEFNSERKLKFGERLGWRKEGKWLSYYNLDFSSKAPPGHLPTWHIFGGFLGGFGLLSVLQTLDGKEKPILWQQHQATQLTCYPNTSLTYFPKSVYMADF